MRTIGAVSWCAVVVIGVGGWVSTASAQFGGGKSPDDVDRRMLQKFEAAAPASASSKPPRTACQCLGDTKSSVERINHVLAQPLKSPGFDFSEQPLEDIVNFLQEEYGIPIKLDTNALEDVGLTADEPVSVQVQDITLKSALRHLLQRLQLTYTIENELLVITTPERAENNLVTCVYDVRDLVGNARSFSLLSDAIRSCIAPETWAANGGGEAEVRPVRPGLFVVSQTQVCHEEIGQLLATIRNMQPISPQLTDGEFGDTPGMGGEFSPAPEEADKPEADAGASP